MRGPCRAPRPAGACQAGNEAPEGTIVRTLSRCERLESAALRAVGQVILLAAAIAILVRLAKWLA